jgi:hypothetical protein
MTKKLITFFIALVLSTFTGIPQSAYAAEFQHLGLTIVWDESTFYEPSGCTSYTFGFLKSDERIIAMIRIENQYGDFFAGDVILSGAPLAGRKSIAICDGKDFTGTKLVLDVRAPQNDVKSIPIVFKKRESSAAKTLPTAAPTPDASEVKSKIKTITCVKGKQTKRVSAVKPKCPAGYKKK